MVELDTTLELRPRRVDDRVKSIDPWSAATDELAPAELPPEQRDDVLRDFFGDGNTQRDPTDPATKWPPLGDPVLTPWIQPTPRQPATAEPMFSTPADRAGRFDPDRLTTGAISLPPGGDREGRDRFGMTNPTDLGDRVPLYDSGQPKPFEVVRGKLLPQGRDDL